MLDINNYYIQGVENLTDLFTIIFTIVDDRNAVWDLYDKYNSISIIGDKVYINKRLKP